MANQIEFTTIDSLYLDPRNPRLGQRNTENPLPQDQVLNALKSWSLEELATSFLESGFWVQEALICVTEAVDGADRLVVVEGNRRLAALKILKQSYAGNPPSPQWGRLIADFPRPDALFDEIPYLKMHSREDVDVFLGYRHVTGIKEWAPAEKAEYIAFLIDAKGWSYQQVMRKIGSRTEAVRRNYISFRMLKQMQDTEGVDAESVQNRFSVLFLALKSGGVQKFLGVDISSNPLDAKTPVPAAKIDDLRDFSTWLFGNQTEPPIVQDSRQVDKFARVLASDEGVRYLRTAKRPTLDFAYQVAGGEEEDVVELVEAAAYNLEQALSTVHLHLDSERLRRAARRLILAARSLEQAIAAEAR